MKPPKPLVSAGEVDCPLCKARPQNPCVDERGTPVRLMHRERLEAAKRAPRRRRR